MSGVPGTGGAALGHVVISELDGPDGLPVLVHRRGGCRLEHAQLHTLLYVQPQRWWEAVADCALDLGVPVCRVCAPRAADLRDAYHRGCAADAS